MFCFYQSHTLYRLIRHVDNRNFSQEAKIVAINDPEVTIEEIAQQLKYDTNYGKLYQNIEVLYKMFRFNLKLAFNNFQIVFESLLAISQLLEKML